MDNTPSSSPQLGLSHADLVVEELVEGGITRLAAFFYSDIPGTVGPVRSMRASDIGIVTPVQASIVTSGAAQITLNRIDGAGITHYGEGYEGFFRESSRSAPYNLMANLTDVASTIKDKLARPDDYLPWGTADDLPKGPKATSINADFGNHTTTWQYGDGRYANTNSFAAADDQFPADSVLVLRVQVGDAGYRDPAGYPVPETKFVGEGAAVLFHAGRVIRGTWKKKELDQPAGALDQAGRPDRPGRPRVDRAGSGRQRRPHLGEVVPGARAPLGTFTGSRPGEGVALRCGSFSMEGWSTRAWVPGCSWWRRAR